MVQHIFLQKWQPGVSDDAAILQPLEAERIEISAPVDKSLLRDPARDREKCLHASSADS